MFSNARLERVFQEKDGMARYMLMIGLLKKHPESH
jgi:hypothetical protein